MSSELSLPKVIPPPTLAVDLPTSAMNLLADATAPPPPSSSSLASPCDDDKENHPKQPAGGVRLSGKPRVSSPSHSIAAPLRSSSHNPNVNSQPPEDTDSQTEGCMKKISPGSKELLEHTKKLRARSAQIKADLAAKSAEGEPGELPSRLPPFVIEHNKKLAADMSSLSASTTDSEASHAAALAGKDAAHKVVIERKEALIKQTKDRMQSMQLVHATQKSKWMNQLAEKNAKIAELGALTTEARAQFTVAQSEITSLRSAAEHAEITFDAVVESRLAASAKEMSEVQNKLLIAMEATEQAEQERKSTQSQLEALKIRTEQERSALTIEKTDLQVKLAAEQMKMVKMQASLINAQHSAEAAQSELVSLKTEHSQQLATLQRSSMEEKMSLESKITSLQQQINSIQIPESAELEWKEPELSSEVDDMEVKFDSQPSNGKSGSKRNLLQLNLALAVADALLVQETAPFVVDQMTFRMLREYAKRYAMKREGVVDQQQKGEKRKEAVIEIDAEVVATSTKATKSKSTTSTEKKTSSKAAKEKEEVVEETEKEETPAASTSAQVAKWRCNQCSDAHRVCSLQMKCARCVRLGLPCAYLTAEEKAQRRSKTKQVKKQDEERKNEDESMSDSHDNAEEGMEDDDRKDGNWRSHTPWVPTQPEETRTRNQIQHKATA